MGNTKTSVERSFELLARYIPILAAVIFSLLLAIYLFNFNDGFADQSIFGSFGDYIGGVLNPILSFLTIFLLIYSIRFQIEELRTTRKEMEESKIELAKSNEISASNVDSQVRGFNAQTVRVQLQSIFDEQESLLNTEIKCFGNSNNVVLKDIVYDKSYAAHLQKMDEEELIQYVSCIEAFIILQNDIDDLCIFIRTETVHKIHYKFKLAQIRQTYRKLHDLCLHGCGWPNKNLGQAPSRAAHLEGDRQFLQMVSVINRTLDTTDSKHKGSDSNRTMT